MRRKEIGSEFWDVFPKKQNQKYVLSGRTALEYIIRDIVYDGEVNSVLMPSYCCHTMIEPFKRHNIGVRFYDVYFDEKHGLSVEVPEFRGKEIFYYMTYYGFEDLNQINMQSVRSQYDIIIEDKTHSWINNDNRYDYAYTSYRKWVGVYGFALAEKNRGEFSIPLRGQNSDYVQLRKSANMLKEKYMRECSGEKDEFLRRYRAAEELLELDYVGFEAPMECYEQFLEFDVEKMAQIRKQNASILLKGLQGLQDVKLIYKEQKENDVPLFVPILVTEGRDELRKYLINNEIYCPVHWPLSELHYGISEKAKRIYEQELSLLCDQRYGCDDMERIVLLIKEFFE